jgi:hypothetical protein
MGGLGTQVRRSVVTAGFLVAVLSASASANHNLLERVSLGPTGGNGAFSAVPAGVSTDGRHIFFETSEQLVAADTDTADDVYDRDPVTGTTTLVSVGSTGQNGTSSASFEGASRDGSHVFFSTPDKMTPDDTDAGAYDVYERYNGATTLTTTGPNGSNVNPLFHYGSFRVSANGLHAYFHTTEALLLEDTDSALDIYERSGGTTRLVSVRTPYDTFLPGTYGSPLNSISADGTRAFFETAESLVAGDNDVCVGPYTTGPCRDVYEWDVDGTLRLVSVGNSPVDPGAQRYDAQFGGISADGSHVFFETREALSNDTDGCVDQYGFVGCVDVYERSGGNTTLISTGPADDLNHHADFAGSTPDGAHAYFTSTGRFTSDDTDIPPPPGYCSLRSCDDLYERYAGTTTLVSTGPTDPQSSYNDYITYASNNALAGTSADGSHVFFYSFLKLTSDDVDRCMDIYERYGNTTSLVSTGPTDGSGYYFCEPTFGGVSSDGSRVFFTSAVPLVPEDSDFGDVNTGGCTFNGDDDERYARPCYDVYERHAGTTSLLSTGPNQTNGPYDAGFQGASDDGRLVSLVTGERLTFDDTDAYTDIFARRLAYLAPSYETPQSAPSIQVALVPTFKPCGQGANSINGKHSPPLAVSSCVPPKPGSDVAVFGPQSLGSAQLAVVPGDGDPGNGDQADVSIGASLTDIKTPAGADYNPSASGPDMTLTARLRITDLSNGPAQTDAATATDLDFAVPINCNGTPDPALGATCAVNTMADVVMPGSIKEGKSTVLQSFRLRVNDSGPNATRGDGDDRIFSTQGIFTP